MNRPTFWWQGVLMVVPVVVLVTVGWWSLKRDERLADEEARERAVWLAERAHAALGLAIRTNVDAYLDYRAELRRDTNELIGAWFRYLGFMTNRPPAEEVTNRYPGKSTWFNRHAAWQADQRTPGGEELKFIQQFEFHDNLGHTIAHYRLNPVSLHVDYHPPAEPGVPGSRAGMFQRARRLEFSGSTVDAIAAYETFLATKPWSEAEMPARYSLAMLQLARGNTNAAIAQWEEVSRRGGYWLAGTHLPIQPLALYHLARLRREELPPVTFRDLCHAIMENQSIMTPLLLERADALLGAEAVAERAMVQASRSEWLLLERTRSLIAKLREEFDESGWTNQVRWWQWEGERFLATVQFTNRVVDFQGGTQIIRGHENGLGDVEITVPHSQTNPMFRVTLVPEAAVDRALARAVAGCQPALGLPPGVSVRLEWNGYQSSPLPAAAVGPALLRFQAPVPGTGGLPDDLAVGLHAAAGVPSPFHVSLQRRRWLFGALIACAALAAFVGLLRTWHAWRHQLRLNQLKTNFVSSVSHELRAPIASVRLMAESLEHGKIPDPGRQQDYFRMIGQETQRLSGLIENVLDFARIEQGRKQYEFEPTDLGALVEATVKVMAPAAAERQVRLELEEGPSRTAAGPWTLCADGRALQQALINLIDNAIKHSPAGKSVGIGWDEIRNPNAASGVKDGVIRLWVRDSGPGIPAEEHARIFEMFYRRGSELRRETPGVGIGLSIVRHIVEAHGGEITVESAPGQGSRFLITLPTQSAAPAPSAPPTTGQEANRTRSPS